MVDVAARCSEGTLWMRRAEAGGVEMIKKIRKVAVLGSGVMGSGIAAHLANAGIPSLMLDIVPFKAQEGEDTSSKAFRNKYAAGAMKKLKKTKPAALYTNADLDLIEIGNFDDDMHRLSECDWIVEVVVERMDIKQQLFAKVEEHRREGTLVTSNTSGLSITGMLEGRSDDFRKHFLVTHFFNPVRYMKLLEIVPGEETLPEATELLADFGAEVLGKGIVYGKDTTNFIANRIGIYGMMRTIKAMVEGGYSVEEVDKVFGPATGRPKSAVFSTADLVGIDTFVHVAQNCYDTLPDDEEREIFNVPDFVRTLVKEGRLGRKSGAGFYKKTKVDGKKAILSLDVDTMEYTAQAKVRFDSLGAARKIDDVGARLKKVVYFDVDKFAQAAKGEEIELDRGSKLAREVTLASLAYSARRMGEIADDVVNIDRGMRWGFNWELGPFEAWDALGVKETITHMQKLDINVADWVIKMVETGHESFYSTNANGEPTFYDVNSGKYELVPKHKKDVSLGHLKATKSANKVAGNLGATLWDIGDGVLGLEFHSSANYKLSPLDDDIIDMMTKSVDIMEADFDGMVIYRDAENFSAGANIMLMLMAAKQGAFDQVEALVSKLQQTHQRLRYSSKPVVAAPSGLARGGGAEVVRACNGVQAAAELYIGLVEVGVGLIPGGGGNLNLLRNLYGRFANDRDFDPLPFIKKAFMTIGMAQVATSAVQGREKGFLKPTDGITLNRDHLLTAAKQRVLGMSRQGFTPPRELKLRLPGRSGAATVDMMLYSMEQQNQISAHDRLIGAKLAGVLCGGDTSPGTPVSEQHLLDLEREVFLSLLGESKTQDRMQHMLMNNKPLRN